jgi:hypothetical protein
MVRIHIPRIDEVFVREQVVSGQMRMNDRRQCHVISGGRSRFPIGNQVRAFRLTGLGEMDLVAGPRGVPFRGRAGFRIAGGTDKRQRGAAEQKTGLSVESREPVDRGRMNIEGVSNLRNPFSF